MTQVYLFGEPRATLDGTEHHFGSSRRYQLLAYLAARRAWVSREQLADLFWSHTDSGAARRNLRKVLFEAKHLAWATGFEQDGRGARWLVASDVAAFEAALARRAWGEAVEVYGGPFLEGLSSDDGAEFEVWLGAERERLGALYQNAAAHHAEALAQAGQAEAALHFLRDLLKRDALNERIHRQVMRLEFGRGNAEAALEQFERCRETLKRELGVEPLPETLELLRTFERGGGDRGKHALLLSGADEVPHCPAVLVGRDLLIQDALAQLLVGERVLLHGFGGMGKTAAAAGVTRAFLEVQGPVLWLQVGSDEPEVALEALAQPFEAQQQLAQVADKAAALKAVLQRQHVALVVLDDAWNAYTLSRIGDALPQGVPLLVTSRQRYPRLTRFYVDRLERAASTMLLQHHAGLPVDEKGSDAGIDALCELLGDHAFAVRLAGLTLREDGGTAAELLARIRSAPHALKAPPELNESGRESIDALLNVSLEPLEDRAFETFLSYGALESPSASAELLACCLEREVTVIEDALFTLVQRGLAERVSRPGSDLVGYRVHDLAHSYARANRFQRPGTLIRASLTHLQAHKDEVELLELDIANLLAAAQLAGEKGQDEDLIALMIVLTVSGTYYMARGHSSRSVALLEQAAKSAKQLGKLHDAHILLGRLGDYQQNFLQNYEGAIDYYQKALEVAREAANQGREAVYLGLIGQVKAIQGAPDALEDVERAYSLAQASHDAYCLYLVTGPLSHVAGLGGDMARANRLFQDALELNDALEHDGQLSRATVVRNRFFTLLNLGESEFRLGNFGRGLAVRQEALTLAEAHGNQVWMGYAYYEIGEMHHAVGDSALALEHMRQALELFEQNNALKDAESVRTFLETGGYSPP